MQPSIMIMKNEPQHCDVGKTSYKIWYNNKNIKSRNDVAAKKIYFISINNLNIIYTMQNRNTRE